MSSPEGSLFAGGAASSPAAASELEGADRFFEPVPAPKRALRAAAFSLSVVDVDGVVLDDAPKVANGDEVGNGDEVPADPKPPTLLPELPKPKAAPVPDGAFAASAKGFAEFPPGLGIGNAAEVPPWPKRSEPEGVAGGGDVSDAVLLSPVG